ncbi:unnamed protein product, partial [Mesorhabditis belari]|uniref:Uncharacterized protein n=1 Tax=Mesorhabditis belari TaxID=2138241 RepID=A0AAF3J8N1_9BILA
MPCDRVAIEQISSPIKHFRTSSSLVPNSGFIFLSPAGGLVRFSMRVAKKHIMANFNPAFIALLPPDALKKFMALHTDDSIDSMAHFDKVVEVLLSLPADIQAKIEALPPPPTYEILSEEFKTKLDAIHKNKSLAFNDKCTKYRKVLASMPEAVDYANQAIMANPDFTMVQLLKELRKMRFHAVQGGGQYFYIHAGLIELWVSGGIINRDHCKSFLGGYKKICEILNKKVSENP